MYNSQHMYNVHVLTFQTCENFLRHSYLAILEYTGTDAGAGAGTRTGVWYRYRCGRSHDGFGDLLLSSSLS